MPIIEATGYRLKCDYCGRECPCIHDGDDDEMLFEHDDWWIDEDEKVWCPDMVTHWREAKENAEDDAEYGRLARLEAAHEKYDEKVTREWMEAIH